MKVLMITWEFPPYIAGGLGMACYGLVKSLLSIGVHVDLLLPTAEEVYFPLRRPEDVDVLPVAHLDPSKGQVFTVQTIENLLERLQYVGLSKTPESYLTPGFDYEVFLEGFLQKQIPVTKQYVESLRIHLRGQEPIFKKVQEMTARVVRYSSTLVPDIIHSHDWFSYPAGMALRGITGRKLVTHIHATEFDRAGGPGDERIHNIEYSGLSSADLVIAVSRYTAHMIIDRYHINPARVRVVHNAYSVSDNIGEAKRKIFKEPLVLFLGRITLQKGPDYFLDVAQKVLQKYKKVRFVMAGSGDMFLKLIKSAAYRRLKDRFLFSGFLNREQVEEMLEATDIFVMPSVSEPFGIVPLEAMAFGCVAMISKQSGVSEVVNNIFKIDFWDVNKMVDVIVDLLENPEKREKIAKAGQQEVFAIGWQKAAEKTFEVYKELCST